MFYAIVDVVDDDVVDQNVTWSLGPFRRFVRHLCISIMFCVDSKFFEFFPKDLGNSS